MSGSKQHQIRVTEDRSIAAVAQQWLRIVTFRPGTPTRLRWSLVLVLAFVACAYSVVTAATRITAPISLPEVQGRPLADASAPESVTDSHEPGLTIQNAHFTPHTQTVAKPQKPRQRQSPQLASLMKLQGIVGTSPPRAILYDVRTKTTHSVVAGQSVGEIEVIEILTTKVILRLNDQTVELSL